MIAFASVISSPISPAPVSSTLHFPHIFTCIDLSIAGLFLAVEMFWERRRHIMIIYSHNYYIHYTGISPRDIRRADKNFFYTWCLFFPRTLSFYRFIIAISLVFCDTPESVGPTELAIGAVPAFRVKNKKRKLAVRIAGRERCSTFQ